MPKEGHCLPQSEVGAEVLGNLLGFGFGDAANLGKAMGLVFYYFQRAVAERFDNFGSGGRTDSLDGS